VKLTRGGEKVAAPPEPETPTPFVGNIEPLTHSLWESMIDMQEQRAKAAAVWERIINLEAKLAKRPNGPKAMKIINRIDLLSFIVREHQWRFLVLEEDVDLRWKQMTARQREEQDLPDMFGCDADVNSMLGAWNRLLGQQKPSRFPLDRIMFKFISPEHAAAYKGRSSWLKDDTVPDSALRNRRESARRSTGRSRP
jgi:hypothetical protein